MMDCFVGFGGSLGERGKIIVLLLPGETSSVGSHKRLSHCCTIEYISDKESCKMEFHSVKKFAERMLLASVSDCAFDERHDIGPSSVSRG